MKIKVREEILRPREEVFATLSRPDVYLSKWARGVLRVTEDLTAKAQGGRSFRITGRDLTRKVYWSYDVLELEQDRVFSGRARGGPVEFSESFHLETNADGTTEITHTHELEPSGAFQLVGPVLRLVWPRLMKDNLRNLKTLIESAPAASS